MSKKLYEESNIQEIASAIREKNEEGSGEPSSETYRVMDMAPAIRALPVINPSDYRKAVDQDIIDNAQNDNISQLREDVYDSTVGLDTKAPAIYKSDSGDMVSFYDGAEGMPLKNLTVNFEPQQDLHGYDSPWPAGGGKNLLPMTVDGIKAANTGGTWNGNTYTYNNMTFTLLLEDDNVVGIRANGTSYSSYDYFCIASQFQVKSGSEYIISGSPQTPSTTTWRLWLGSTSAFSSGNRLSDDKEADRRRTASADETVTVYIQIFEGQTLNNLIFHPMIRFSSASDPTFAPYSNICPIEGYTGCNITRTGKNLLPFTVFTATVKGITFVINNDGSIIANGTATDNAQLVLSFFNLEGNYYFTGCAYTSDKSIDIYAWDTSSNTRFKKWDSTSASDSNYDLYTLTPFKVPKGHNGAIVIRIKSGTVVDNVTFYPMICAATETDPTFEPYQGQTYPISWQTEADTVYGGTLDAITGLLTVDRAAVDLGTLAWTESSNNCLYSRELQSTIKAATQNTIPVNAISEEYKIYSHTELANKSFNGLAVNDIGTVYVRTTTSPEGKLVFELATPITYHLTPQQITTLLGTNNIWSDIGHIELTYPADTKTYVDNYQTDDIDSLQEMSSFFNSIPGTTETVSFDQNGRPESIVHANEVETVRTDTFEWGDNTVTETRTLANGRHIIMATDLSTLITTISEIQEGT